jgi:hypothetical protein
LRKQAEDSHGQADLFACIRDQQYIMPHGQALDVEVGDA